MMNATNKHFSINFTKTIFKTVSAISHAVMFNRLAMMSTVFSRTTVLTGVIDSNNVHCIAGRIAQDSFKLPRKFLNSLVTERQFQ